MDVFTYITKSNAKYTQTINGKNSSWEREGEKLEDAFYISEDIRDNLIEKIAEGITDEGILKNAKKQQNNENYKQRGGLLIYLIEGKLYHSSAVVKRIPDFKN